MEVCSSSEYEESSIATSVWIGNGLLICRSAAQAHWLIAKYPFGAKQFPRTHSIVFMGSSVIENDCLLISRVSKCPLSVPKVKPSNP